VCHRTICECKAETGADCGKNGEVQGIKDVTVIEGRAERTGMMIVWVKCKRVWLGRALRERVDAGWHSARSPED
jgi:hypothetical protein